MTDQQNIDQIASVIQATKSDISVSAEGLKSQSSELSGKQ